MALWIGSRCITLAISRAVAKATAFGCFAMTVMLPDVASAQSDYSLPKDLTPVWEWKNGFSSEQATAFRNGYQASDTFFGNDRSAFAFLNLSEVLPTMTILRDGDISPLESTPIPEIAEVVATTELGTLSLADIAKDPRSRLQAFAVIHKGKIVYEEYPGMPPLSKHVWSSTAKTISGLLIHMLEEDGLVDLDMPVQTYLSYTQGSPIGAVSVRDVLNMRSGIDFEENQANRQDPEHPVAWAFAGALSARGVPAGPSLSEIVIDVPVEVPPNTVFGYSTFNTLIIGQIVEAVTGKPWNQVFGERVWQKSGMQGDGQVALSPAGEGLWGGILSGHFRDFMRYGLLYTPSWNTVAKERVVSENYLEKVYADVNPEIYLRGEAGPKYVTYFAENGGAPIGNAYQWDAVFEDGDLYKSGLLGQGLYVSPETDTVVVWFSTTWQNIHPMTAYPRAIVKQVFRE